MKIPKTLWAAAALLCLAACSKSSDNLETGTGTTATRVDSVVSTTTTDTSRTTDPTDTSRTTATDTVAATTTTATPATGTTTYTAPAVATGYTLYTIKAGQHYCDKNSFKPVTLAEQKFSVRFDSSGIYKTIDPVNQYDINKLYGFSEGLNHEYNSARIGWSWTNGAMRLYAYSYKNSVRQSKEITAVPLNQEIACSIKVSGYNYIFTVNGVSVTLSRAKNTATASGYQLFPYFGGDEAAPHDVFIQIKSL
ncbi:hypothetical protein V9K67_09310 [Paraflavisolibacter sp. H34]|uniref:hypothetical protein n=1 Tax=Huijunlia imazamoxiresistens TaxID=3127457 RepID=UPI0030167DD0